MKIGDHVRVTGLPAVFPDDDLQTKKIFSLCLGEIFPIMGYHDHLIELHVGGVISELPFMHSIWIEPEFVEVVSLNS